MTAALRHSLSERMIAAMARTRDASPPRCSGMEALVEDAEQEAFRRLGVAHLLVVSGFHVGVLAKCVGLLFGKCSKRFRFVLLAVLLLCYSLLTGLNAPVVRAALLLLLAEYGRLRCRQVIPLFMLCASALIQLAFSPALLTGASFQLSYGAVAESRWCIRGSSDAGRPESKAISGYESCASRCRRSWACWA